MAPPLHDLPAAMIGAARFLRQYLFRPAGRVVAEEATYLRGDRQLGASLYRPVAARATRPAWIILHGLTHAGRRHLALNRFARAVAASGTIVFIPEVPEWQQLRVAPAITFDTILAALDALDRRPEIAAGRIGVIGFSFGATHALAAAADPALHGRLAGIAAWGGYCDPLRLFHFGITGEHELDGEHFHIEPDPYGRWIMGGNYLTAIPEYGDHAECAAALYDLALEAGRGGRFAWDPHYDAIKTRLRAAMPPAQRAVFDLFAARTDVPAPPREQAAELARQLAAAAVRREPLLDIRGVLEDVGTRVLLAHGRDDRLVPFTETLRLERYLNPERCGGSMVTSLFAHSGHTSRQLGPLGLTREAARFAFLLHRILELV
jgi:predicted esterase